MGVGRWRANVDHFVRAFFSESRLPTPYPTLPHKGGGRRIYRPVRASECTQPCMRFLALAMSSLEKKSSGFTLSTG